MNAIAAPPRIDTERLALRPLRADDAETLAALADDFEVARMITAMPHPLSLEDAQSFVERMEQLDAAREATFAIERRGVGLAGVLGFYCGGPLGPEIGYWIGRAHWGQGLATEAACAAIAWAQTSWRRRVVVAGHFVDNPASGRVLEKAGFLYTGEVQERHCRARDAVMPTRMMIWLA